MIVRVWRATAAPHLAHLYIEHFTDAVLPRLRTVTGFRGAYLLRRAGDDSIEFVVQTLWDSMEAVQRFAGPAPNVAVVDDEARAVLLTFDSAVQHYETLVSPSLVADSRSDAAT